MAEALARAGAAVVVGDIRTELGEATADAIKKAGGDAAFLPLDVTSDHSWERTIEGTIAELGGLDIVVNNAGVEISSLVVDLDPDDIRKMLEVNILGTSLGLKHAFRAMRPGGPAGRGGAVVNIASVAATIAFPGIAVYSATKSAVDRLTRVAAMESGKLGYGVRVNCVYPGLVPTEMGNQLAQDMVTLGLFPSVEECAPPSSGSPRTAVWARSRTWPTPWSSSPPMRPVSSPAPGCPSTAAWACDSGIHGNSNYQQTGLMQAYGPPHAPVAGPLATARSELIAQLQRDRTPAALVVVHLLGRKLLVLDRHQRLVRAVILQHHGDLALHRRIRPRRATPGEPEPPGPVHLDEPAGHVQ